MSSFVPISHANMRIIAIMAGRDPLTVHDLVEATGVTRTAVTEQLHDLEALGLVGRSIEQASRRGRPRHLYTTTPSAMRALFQNQYCWPEFGREGPDQQLMCNCHRSRLQYLERFLQLLHLQKEVVVRYRL